ncbi:ABC transporter permease [Ovoidimarina sediminis]|uniref:ABC transporter permease n=1 Tax=Ovoidimarina sediminis TaxID=3079856 RepID=UPI0029108081|nr:FtsX-like permease family protein [Rhodophyticola sp. MJ-SS7]MDU8943744.1 FtsX-like permease family protein [Rhodophyticola sp. MJ-SS7]
MQALDRKLLRDFARLWAQFLAIALVLAAGVAVLLMSFGMSRALDETRDTYYERNRFADIFTDARSVPRSMLPILRGIEGVVAVEARVTTFATLDLPDKTDATVAYFASLPEGGSLLNIPLLRRGDWPDPDATDQVLLNEPFAMANGLFPGTTITATLNGTKRSLTVTGWVLSPEFIYTIGPGSLIPDNEDYGIAWMPERVLEAVLDRTGAFDNLAVKIRPDMRPEPVIDALDRLLEPYGSWGAIDRTDQISNAFIDGEITQLQTLAYTLPPIFLGITVFLVNMVIGRIVTLERTEIGLLKALGYSDAAILTHYLLLAALVAAVGVLIGFFAGSWLSYGLARLYANFFNFPYLIYNVSWNTYVIAGLLGLGAATLGAARSAWKAARLAPATAMSPPAPPRFKRNWFDLALNAIRVSQPTMMILRSLIRWPVRAGLSILGMALAVAILVASNFFPDALDHIIDSAFHQSNRQHAVLFFNDLMPESALEDARRLPGVLQAEGQQYLTAVLRNEHRAKRVAIEARRPGNDLSRVVAEDGTVVEAPPGGIVLSRRLAAQLGVRPGDLVEAEFRGNRQGTFELPVTRLVTQYFGLGAYMDQETADRLFQQAPQVSVINVTLDAAETDAFEERLKELPRLAGRAMMLENREGFQETISRNILITTTIYTTLGILITVGVAYNGARIQLSERARELASLRILGFTRGEVGYVLVGEMMLLAVIAQPVGWFLGWGIARLMSEAFTSDLYAIPLIVKPATFSSASLVVLAAAFVSVLIVRRRLDRLNLVSVMKTRE